MRLKSACDHCDFKNKYGEEIVSAVTSFVRIQALKVVLNSSGISNEVIKEEIGFSVTELQERILADSQRLLTIIRSKEIEQGDMMKFSQFATIVLLSRYNFDIPSMISDFMESKEEIILH